MANLSELPDDLLLHIVSFVPLSSWTALQRTFFRLNLNTLNALAQLQLVNGDEANLMPLDMRVALVRNCKSLRHINGLVIAQDFECSGFSFPMLQLLLRNNKLSLEHLILYDGFAGALHSQSLLNIVSISCPSLRTLYSEAVFLESCISDFLEKMNSLEISLPNCQLAKVALSCAGSSSVMWINQPSSYGLCHGKDETKRVNVWSRKSASEDSYLSSGSSSLSNSLELYRSPGSPRSPLSSSSSPSASPSNLRKSPLAFSSGPRSFFLNSACGFADQNPIGGWGNFVYVNQHDLMEVDSMAS